MSNWSCPGDRTAEADRTAAHNAHGGRIAFIDESEFGKAVGVDARTRTVFGETGEIRGDVVSFIPAQQAGRIARLSGLSDASGWCPADPETQRSPHHPAAFLVGDTVGAEIGETPAETIARQAARIAASLGRSTKV